MKSKRNMPHYLESFSDNVPQINNLNGAFDLYEMFSSFCDPNYLVGKMSRKEKKKAMLHLCKLCKDKEYETKKTIVKIINNFKEKKQIKIKFL